MQDPASPCSPLFARLGGLRGAGAWGQSRESALRGPRRFISPSLNTIANLRHVRVNKEGSQRLELDLKSPESKIYLYKVRRGASRRVLAGLLLAWEDLCEGW